MKNIPFSKIVRFGLPLPMLLISVLLVQDWWNLRIAQASLEGRLSQLTEKSETLVQTQLVAEQVIDQVELNSKSLVGLTLKNKKIDQLLKLDEHPSLTEVDDIADVEEVSESEFTEYDDKTVLGRADAMLSSLAKIQKKQELSVSKLRGLNQSLVSGAEITNAIPSIMPADGWLSSTFGYRKSPFHGGKRRMHRGVDLAARKGTKVFATADGVVEFTGRRNGYGRLVVINHGFGIQTRYGHNGRIYVKAGQTVKKGQKISSIGMTGRTTGPHVHYEVLIRGRHVDPARFLKPLMEFSEAEILAQLKKNHSENQPSHMATAGVAVGAGQPASDQPGVKQNNGSLFDSTFLFAQGLTTVKQFLKGYFSGLVYLFAFLCLALVTVLPYYLLKKMGLYAGSIIEFYLSFRTARRERHTEKAELAKYWSEPEEAVDQSSFAAGENEQSGLMNIG